MEQQKYNNCGPEVIENFMQYLTGERIDQDSAIAIHSILFEDTIIGDNNHSIYDEEYMRLPIDLGRDRDMQSRRELRVVP